MAQSDSNSNHSGLGTFDSKNGFSVNGTTVINSSGKVVESAGIEISNGDSFLDNNGNEVVKFGVVSSAVNEVTIKNAATGNMPIIAASGEADTGLRFENGESEAILILDAVATGVNQITIANAAASAEPVISATGSDTDIDIKLTPKGAGNVNITGARGISSSISNAYAGFILGAAQQAVSTATAVNLTSYNTTIDSTSGALALTLAASTLVGQLKRIQMIVDNGDATLTVTSLSGGTTITFADVGDTAELMWNGTNWIPLALYNVADGATAPVLA